MRLRVKSIFRIKKEFDRFNLRLKRATTAAMKEAGEGLKLELRGQVTGAGMGQRLANTWRHEVYPKGGRVSANAAASVYSKAPHIIAAFDQGTVIRARGGTWLAIPTDNVPKGSRGRRLSPANWPDRLGKLSFVRLRNGNAMLVAEGLRASYDKFGFVRGYRRAAESTVRKGYSKKRGFGLVTVPMFFLVRQAAAKKRLDVAAAAKKWGASLPGAIERNMGHDGR